MPRMTITIDLLDRPLELGTKIFSPPMPLRERHSLEPPVLEVVANPKRPDVLGIRNEAQETILVRFTTETKQLLPGKICKLRHGMKVRLDNQWCEITVSEVPPHELIIYATPTGQLAAQLQTYWRRAGELGPTTAQTFPAHCSMTGFFHRGAKGLDHAIEIVSRTKEQRPLAQGAVMVHQLVHDENIVFLDLLANELVFLTIDLVAEFKAKGSEEPLRLKRNPHLSLAYGAGELRPYAELARDTLDISAKTAWEIGLWERLGEKWKRHA